MTTITAHLVQMTLESLNAQDDECLVFLDPVSPNEHRGAKIVAS